MLEYAVLQKGSSRRILARPLWIFWSRGLSRNGGWRRKLHGLVVQLKGRTEIEPRPCSLGKLRSWWLGGGGRWRRKLHGLVVQLKRWTEIKPKTLWRLHHDGSLPVREVGGVMHITVGIHVDGGAAFRVEDLLQAFLCTWLLR